MYVNRKPLNQLESPVYPFIQKDPQRSYFVKKHWTVDVGDTISDQSNNPDIFDGSILAVARDENQTRYGARSYIPKVNKEFRPPLIDPEYDLVALSRIPRPRTQMRINPDVSEFTPVQNIHGMDVTSMIDDRVLKGSVRPSYTIAIEKPIEVIVPNLKLKMPQVQASSSTNVPMNSENSRIYVTPLEDKNPNVYALAGVDMPTTVNGQNSLEYLDLDYNNPMVQALAGQNIPFSEQNTTSLENIELEYKNPQVSGDSGRQSQYKYNSESGNQYKDLKFNMPQASVRINADSLVRQQSYEPQTIKLQEPIRINYQATKNIGVEKNCVNETPTLKPTLTYERSVNSNAVIPAKLQVQTPSLKSKKGTISISGY